MLVRPSFVHAHITSKRDEVSFLPFAFELTHVLGSLHVEGALSIRIVNLIRSERVAERHSTLLVFARTLFTIVLRVTLSLFGWSIV